MNKTNSHRNGDVSPTSVVRTLLATLVGTTLRIFVPTLGLFAIGWLIGAKCDAEAIGMIAGAVVGIIIAIILVLGQLRKIRRAPLNHGAKPKAVDK